MYTERYDVATSLLSVFPGYNLDDPSQLAASGGVRLPAYAKGTGSLRARGTMRWASSGYVPTVRDWYPVGGDSDAIDVLVRTASSSNLDWARPPTVNPLTLAARFTSASSMYPMEEVILVDILPTATVAELKVALLLAAGRPAPAGQLDALTLWRVDMSAYELAYLDAQGGLDDGRRPAPIPRTSAPCLALADPNAPVSDYITSRCSRADPYHIDLSAHIHPCAISALAPRITAPAFTYPMPAYLLEAPRQRRRAPLPLPSDGYAYGDISAWASSSSRDSSFDSSLDSYTEQQFTYPEVEADPADAGRPVVCSVGYESLGSAGLIGLGITMTPVGSAESDHTCSSRDEECVSWPPTPHLGETEGEPFEGPTASALALGWTPVVSEQVGQTPKHLQALFVPPTPTFA